MLLYHPVFPPAKTLFLSMSRLLICCILLNFSHSLPAQQFSFHAYTPANGLVDARVQKMYQDSRGVLYFLTRDGFSSYDGQRFNSFTSADNKPISIVYDMQEQADGSLLVAAAAGLFRLKDDRLVKDTLLSSLLGETGSFLSLGGGRMANLTATGVKIVQGTSVRPLTDRTTGAIVQLDRAIIQDNIIAGITTPSGSWYSFLLVYNIETGERTDSLRLDSPDAFYTVNNKLFVKTAAGWQQAAAAALIKGKIVLEPVAFSNAKWFYETADGQRWIFYADHSVRFSGTSGQQAKFREGDDFPENIADVFCDREKHFWMLTPGNGVYKLVHRPLRQLQLPAFQTMLVTEPGKICLANGYQWQLQQETNWQPGAAAASSSLIAPFYYAGKMRLLFSDATLQFDANRKLSFAAFRPEARQVSPHIQTDTKGRLLLAGDMFAMVYRDSLLAATALPYFTDIIAPGENNQYWCFTRNGLVLVFRLEGNRLQQVKQYRDTSYSARYAIYAGHNQFYVGTRNNGVLRITADTVSYRVTGTVSRAAGLSNNFVTGLALVNRQTLLAATAAGLDKIALQPGALLAEQLFSAMGLFTGVRYLAKQNDSSWLALTDNGKLFSVQLPTRDSDAPPKKTFFHSITVNGVPVDPLQTAHFNYRQNNLRILVSAPSFTDEKNIRFAYQLNGRPVPGGQNGNLELINLAPGKYQLDVQVYFPGETSAPGQLSYSFIIAKPFWKTTGFIIALTAFILATIYLSFRVLLRRKLRRQEIELAKEKAIAEERTRIARDMHDDLGAGISTIKYLSQAAPFVAPDIQQENNLKISQQADELVDNMNDIIWAMNEKNDTLANLLLYTKSWAAAFLEQHSIQYRFDFPAGTPDLVIRGEKRRHIFLCIKEALHNMVKHAKAGNCIITATLSAQQLDLVITDDGIGFDTTKKSSGNGLSNMQKRMQSIGGTVQYSGRGGTVVHFSIQV